MAEPTADRIFWDDPLKYRWLIFGVCGMIYFVTMLHRVAPTVVARDMALAFNADATMLGVIASSYFYLYSAVQPPVGMLVDSIGPRRVVAIFTLIAALGTAIFAGATNAAMATVGRALIGAGVGGIFVPSLKLFSWWYRPTEFAGLTGLLLTVGGIGSISAGLPLTYLVVFSGWRASFYIIAGFTLLMAVCGWVVIRDKPEDKGWPPVSGTSDLEPAAGADPLETFGALKRLRLVIANRNFWLVTVAAFFAGGVSLCFQGLWAVPYLIDVYAMSRVKAGGLLMLIPFGFAVSAPLVGFLLDRLSLNRKGMLLATQGLAIACWAVILICGGRPPSFLIGPFFLVFGFVIGAAITLYMTIIKELFPPWLIGTAIGLMNPAAFFAAALYQPFTGYLLDLGGQSTAAGYPLEAYRLVFITFLISLLIALAGVAALSLPKQEDR